MSTKLRTLCRSSVRDTPNAVVPYYPLEIPHASSFSFFRRTNPKLRLAELAQAADMGVAQELESESFRIVEHQTSERIIKARDYMEGIAPELKKMCLNQQSLCFVWAAYGECETNADCE